MEICSNCGNEVEDSNFCPNCGTKIKKTPQKSFCTNCGQEVSDSAFCPNCGTKILNEVSKSFCSNCGEQIDDLDQFCSNCGWSKNQNNNSQNQSDSTFDELIDVDNKISGKLSKLFGKSKLMNKTLDVAGSLNYKHSKGLKSGDIKYYQKIEPVFLEALETIDDQYVKSILIYERSIISSSGSVFGVVASQIYTPTKDMPHDEAIKYYQNWANTIKMEINKEKQNGTFDEEEFYKSRVKKATLDNTSFFGISKSVKKWKNNQK